MKIIISQLILPVIFLLPISNILSQTPDVTNDLIVRNEGTNNTALSFGLDATASDEIDDDLGELDLPPLPPVGAWDVRLILPPNNWTGLSSWKDYRLETNFPYTGTREHRIQYQLEEGKDSLFFEWNFPAEVTGVLQDLITGTIVNQPVQGSGSFLLVRGGVPDPTILNQLKMTINYNNVVAEIISESKLPSDFHLYQNFPNPFNPSTTIYFSLPTSSEISLKVFDMLGNEISTIASGFFSAGKHNVNFNGASLSSGIYLYQLKYEGGAISQKMILMK